MCRTIAEDTSVVGGVIYLNVMRCWDYWHWVFHVVARYTNIVEEGLIL